MRIVFVAALVWLVVAAPFATAKSKRSKRRKSSARIGPDISAELFAQLDNQQFADAVKTLRRGPVAQVSTRPDVLCALAGAWKNTRKEHFRQLFIGLVGDGAATDCEVRTPGHQTLPLLFDLARDANFAMLKEALVHGGSFKAKPGQVQLTLLKVLLIHTKERSSVYGHIGMALRRNLDMLPPKGVKQFDLEEHRRLSPSLDQFIDSRNDKATYVTVNLTDRISDEVISKFLKMAERLCQKDEQHLLFTGEELAPLITKNLAQTAQFLLLSTDVDWKHISSQDHGGLTAAHYAQLMPGREQLMSHLSDWAIAHGHDLQDAHDKWGRSANDDAFKHAWDRYDSKELAVVEAQKQNGWAPAPARHSRTPRCEIMHFEGLPSAADFHKKFVSVGKPVLMRGAVSQSSLLLQLRQSLQKDSLMRRHANERWKVGSVPYASQFGMEETNPTLSDFVQQMKSGDRKYIFQNTQDPSMTGNVLAAMTALTDDLKHWVKPTKVQFYLGPVDSGAPLHYHADAINVLAHGTKHWYLQPPQDAEYHTNPVFEWETLSLPLYPESRKPIECTQQAGDLIYVPQGWGHATLNWQESVGVAVEFGFDPGITATVARG